MGEFVQIRSLRPGAKDINLMFIVLDINRPTKTKEGREVRTVKIADRSACINLSLWDEIGKLIQTGDIIRMTKGYVNIFKNCLTLYLSKASEFQKVGDFCMVFMETPNMSDPMPESAQVPVQSGVPPGGNGGPNKPMFRGPGNNGSNNLPGQQPPPHAGVGGGPPQVAGGNRFPSNGERAAPPGGHLNNSASGNLMSSQNKWPVGGGRPMGIKDKIR